MSLNDGTIYRESGAIVADILQNELALTDKQVLFTNQKYLIPTVGILVVVSYVGPSKVIANVSGTEDDGQGGLREVQSATLVEMIQIDILGFGNDVRMRRNEIPLALHSIYAEQQMEAHCMQVARQSSGMADTSFLEATKMITRYTTTVLATTAIEKKKAVPDIYTDFSLAVPPTLIESA